MKLGPTERGSALYGPGPGADRGLGGRRPGVGKYSLASMLPPARRPGRARGPAVAADPVCGPRLGRLFGRATDVDATFAHATAGAGSEVPHRAQMEQAFGADFGGVRAHLGQADAMAGLEAHAASRGDAIAFATGAPDPRLVAHELTHVMQARHHGAPAVQAKGVATDAHPAEREADRVADQVVAGRPVEVREAPSAALHRSTTNPQMNLGGGRDLWGSSDSELDSDFDQDEEASAHDDEDAASHTSSPAPAFSGPLFGTEMTFTNERLVALHKPVGLDGPNLTLMNALREVRTQWAALVMELADAAGIDLERDDENAEGVRFVFPDCAPFHGWWFTLKFDRPCIELSTQPATTAQYEALLSYVQHFVFDAAAEVGLFPDPQWGGGHIHIDAATGFDDDPVKLLNFMTDINNMGIWPFQNSRMMRMQSTPIAVDSDRNESERKRYARLLLDERKKQSAASHASQPLGLGGFDAFAELDAEGKDEDDLRGAPLMAVMNKLNDTVYREEPKYQMLNTSKAAKGKYGAATLEIRAFDAQSCAADLLLQLQLIAGALDQTATDKVRAYQPPEPIRYDYEDDKQGMVLSGESVEVLAPRIVAYFEQIEIPIDDYIHMMPVELQAAVMKHAKVEQLKHPARASRASFRPISALDDQFRRGRAEGTGNNCLLYTLHQLANTVDGGELEAAVETMRKQSDATDLVEEGDMIDLYSPIGNAIVAELGLHIQVHQVVGQHVLVHPPIGDSSKPLQHVLHQGLHFTPLWPLQPQAEDTHEVD